MSGIRKHVDECLLYFFARMLVSKVAGSFVPVITVILEIFVLKIFVWKISR